MKIAIDAMGGDNAPESIIQGVNLAKKEFSDIEFLLFGDGNKIRALLDDEKQVQIIETTEIIDFHDDPVTAIKNKKDSSLVRALQAVKAGEAQAILSAGSTGALFTGSLLHVKRIRQISRAALMSTLPTMDGRGFDMLDLGANTENTAQHLNDYATLGSYYAEQVRGITKPRVALLSNGAEESKGTPTVKEAHALLAARHDINFIGNIESRDLLTGAADVVVADGFTGNAVLKAIEGTMSALLTQIKSTIKNGNTRTKIGGLLVQPALSSLRDMANSGGGAPLVGLRAPVVKAHGNSGPAEIATAIRQLHKMLDSDLTGKLISYFEQQNQA